MRWVGGPDLSPRDFRVLSHGQCLRIARDADSDAVGNLRLAAYAGSREFLLTRPEALAWSPEDESATVLVAVNDAGEIVSTMRGRVLRQVSDFEHISGFDLRGVELPVPTLFLDRAATREGDGHRGLNAVLRLHFLLGALAGDIASVSGVTRARTMTELGYAFTPARPRTPDATRHMRSDDRIPVVAALPRDRLTTAVNKLEELVVDTLQNWPWRGKTYVVRADDAAVHPAAHTPMSGMERKPLVHRSAR
jgi:hypothetical protein